MGYFVGLIKPNKVGIEELINLNIEGKNVLIIGCPASGKTWICNKMAKSTHTIIHTDSYILYGYQAGMYCALDAANMSTKPTIVEGVHGYRMLRKGCEYGSYYPDIVIEMKISDVRMVQTYTKERDEKKIKYLKQFNETHAKILNDYRGMCPKHKKPEWITFLNNY